MRPRLGGPRHAIFKACSIVNNDGLESARMIINKRSKGGTPRLSTRVPAMAFLVIAGCGGGGGSSSDPAAMLQISTASLPNGQVGQAYRAPLSASGGTAPYAWSLSNGTLPAGLMLSSDGVISGTPTVSSGTSFTIQVKDSSQPAAESTRSFMLTVQPA